MRYLILPKVLGEGAYSKVYLCRDTETRKYVAAKKIPISNGKNKSFDRGNRIAFTLNHPNIIKVLDMFIREEEDGIEYLIVIMEYKKNTIELFTLVQKITESEDSIMKHDWDRRSYKIAIQILKLIAYLHENNVVHGDIKMENFLVDRDDNIFLIDFDMMYRVDESGLHDVAQGTIAYSCPEIVEKLLGGDKDSEYLAKEAEVWSLGVALYTLFTGKFPFAWKYPDEMLEAQLDKGYISDVLLEVDWRYRAIFKRIFCDESSRWDAQSILRMFLSVSYP